MRALPFVLAFVVVAGAPCTARAADGAAGSPAAEERYREGFDAFKRWNFEAARRAFLQAYTIDPKPKYLWNLAVSEVKSSHPAEGLTHFRQYFAGPDATPKDREQARVLMSEAEAKTGHVVVQAPAGASLFVDGERSKVPQGQPVDVTPGSHSIEIRMNEIAIAREFDVRAGETQEMRFDAPPAPTPAPHPPEVTPAPSVPPPPAGELPATTAAPRPETARWVTSGAMVGLGVAGLVAGGVFYANASSDYSKWQSLSAQTGVCPQPPTSPACTSLKSAWNARGNDQTLGGAFVGLGSTLVIAGVATWIVWPLFGRKSTADNPAEFVTAIVFSGGGGATWNGSF